MSSVVQTFPAPNVVSTSPPQAVAQNTPTVAPVPVAPILTPPPSLSAPVTSASPAETPTTTAPAEPTLAAVATPSPASPTATAGTEPSAAASVVSPFAIGSHVRVQLELEIHVFRMMQEGHGGWMDDMAEVKDFTSQVFHYYILDRVFYLHLNPAMSITDGEGEDLGVHLKLLSLLENPAVIVAAAASGDIATLKDYLSKHPQDVRTNTDSINVHSRIAFRVYFRGKAE